MERESKKSRVDRGNFQVKKVTRNSLFLRSLQSYNH